MYDLALFAIAALGMESRKKAKFLGMACEADGMRQGREDGVETLRYSLRVTREIDDDRLIANSGCLARQYGSGYFFHRDGTHSLAEAGEHFVAHGGGGLWSNVARSRSGATRGEDKAAVFGEVNDGFLYLRLLVGHDDRYNAVGLEVLLDERLDGWSTTILVCSVEGSVGHRKDADTGAVLSCCCWSFLVVSHLRLYWT